MNRRGFLGSLVAAVAGASLDPEKLLWVPGRKLISIPKPRLVTGTELLAIHDEFFRRYVGPTLLAIQNEIYEHALHGIPYPPAFHRDAFVLSYPRLGR